MLFNPGIPADGHRAAVAEGTGLIAAEGDIDQPLALRGLRWFQHRFVLSHGAQVANAPLTPTERSVFLALLGSETEKQIAEAMGKSQNTVHIHVKAIYHKFGVRNRAALTVLGQGALARPRGGAKERHWRGRQRPRPVGDVD